MRRGTQGYTHQTTMLCIDALRDGVLAGRLYHALLPEGRAFRSLTDLLKQMEALLDDPRRAPPTGSGPPPESLAGVPPDGERRGRLGTFAVQVVFRQNASWQGSVVWLETGRKETFRSVLELILLLDSALPGAATGSQNRVPDSPSCIA